MKFSAASGIVRVHISRVNVRNLKRRRCPLVGALAPRKRELRGIASCRTQEDLEFTRPQRSMLRRNKGGSCPVRTAPPPAKPRLVAEL